LKIYKPIFYFLFLFPVFSNAQSGYNSLFNEGVILLNDGKYKEAIAKLDKALDLKNEVDNKYLIADGYIYRGYCAYKLENYSTAHKDVLKAIALKKEYTKPYYYQSLIYSAEKKYDLAIASCDSGLIHKPGDASLLVNKAKNYLQQKNYSKAREPLHFLLSSDPKNIPALRFIASSYLRQKIYDSSVVYFSKAIEIDPVDFISYYDRGISRSYTKDEEGAKNDIEYAMKLDTATKEIGYNNLGYFLKLEKGKYAEAIPFFNEAIKLDPVFAYAYSNRGLAKFKLGDPEAALADLKQSLKLDKTNSYAYKNLAIIYFGTDKKSKGCDCLKKADELGYSEQYDDEVETLTKANCPK
jgi:tetratricopeptide (TPR) repeat protein